VGIDDLAVPDVTAFAFRNLMTKELMQSANTNASLSFVSVRIVITDVKKEVSIIEDTNAGKSTFCGWHSFVLSEG
jgi:hypothetical protein